MAIPGSGVIVSAYFSDFLVSHCGARLYSVLKCDGKLQINRVSYDAFLATFLRGGLDARDILSLSIRDGKLSGGSLIDERLQETSRVFVEVFEASTA